MGISQDSEGDAPTFTVSTQITLCKDKTAKNDFMII
jgi:hypothetical protein